jgi:HPt (histidine-containing phosphotransfer) domain-containing protein
VSEALDQPSHVGLPEIAQTVPDSLLPMWSTPVYLSEMYDEDPAVAIELLQIFLDDTDKRLATLPERILANDGKSVCSIAHTLKGSACQLGALRFADMAEALEAGASDANWQAVTQWTSSLQTTFAALRVEVLAKMRVVALNLRT